MTIPQNRAGLPIVTGQQERGHSSLMILVLAKLCCTVHCLWRMRWFGASCHRCCQRTDWLFEPDVAKLPSKKAPPPHLQISSALRRCMAPLYPLHNPYITPITHAGMGILFLSAACDAYRRAAQGRSARRRALSEARYWRCMAL